MDLYPYIFLWPAAWMRVIDTPDAKHPSGNSIKISGISILIASADLSSHTLDRSI